MLLGLAQWPALADDITAAGADAIALPLDGDADQDSKGVVLVIGGAARGFADSLDPPTRDPSSMQRTYFRLEMGDGFSLGGAYAYGTGDNDIDPTGTSALSLGASMNLDDWTFGVGWATGDTGEILVELGDKDDNVVSFTTSYSVQPGIRIDGLLEYRDAAAQPDPDNSGFAIGLGSLINF